MLILCMEREFLWKTGGLQSGCDCADKLMEFRGGSRGCRWNNILFCMNIKVNYYYNFVCTLVEGNSANTRTTVMHIWLILNLIKIPVSIY